MAKQDSAPRELGDVHIELFRVLALVDGARALVNDEEWEPGNVTRLLEHAHDDLSELIDAFGSALEREPRHG